MLALLDADIIIYRVGFTTENEEEFVARARCDDMIEGILAEVGATEYQLWLSDSTENNFRLQFYPQYKANRKNFVKPKHFDLLKKYVITNWGAQITCNQEADDALGIEQAFQTSRTEGEDHYISTICSIDKDLLQIPGSHYNFVKKERIIVTPEDGIGCFYRQLLTGDVADNIQGCPQVGSVRADKALEGAFTEGELFERTRRCYYQYYAKHIFKVDEDDTTGFLLVDKEILRNGRCLKIRTYEGQIWDFPEE